jgi:acetyl-CoA synthetase
MPTQKNKTVGLAPTEYARQYADSITDPASFWADRARAELDWFTPFSQAFEWTKPNYRWFLGGKLNITHNCLDRHVNAGRGDRLAYIYVNEWGEEVRITYAQLLERVCKSANALKVLGVKKGDRVILYMPLGIEQIALMLGCARIGAIHSVVYAGFSAEALAVRIKDTQASVVCATTWTQKAGKKHDLLAVVREAVHQSDCVKHVLVSKRKGDNIALGKNELELDALLANQPATCAAEPMDSSDPLFILYTSGTTGTPKGIVHGHGGYSLYAHLTMKLDFALGDAKFRKNHIHWALADTGWITGHSYIVYGPLSNGVTSVLYEGSPLFPKPDYCWQLIEKYHVQTFYTAPTVIRMMMREGEKYPAAHDLSSLKVLGSVGEPINPKAWEWYFKFVGGGHVPVIDTWWQTENGGHMLVTQPSMKQKPGSAGLPFLGIQPALVDDDGNEITAPNTIGHLVIKHPWPGALMTCWNNPKRFAEYWSEFAGAGHDYFYTGDIAQRDVDGYYTVLGRADDVMNVAGIRVGTAEVESALVSHPAVAEAAAISISDDLKGEVIKAFVLLNKDFTLDPALEKALKLAVRKKIGPHAMPSVIESVAKLPKTRSGKIMRRILKAKELGLVVGDTSTLED